MPHRAIGDPVARLKELAEQWHHDLTRPMYVNTVDGWARFRCKKCDVIVHIRADGSMNAPPKFRADCIGKTPRYQGRPYQGQHAISDVEYTASRRAARLLARGKGHDIGNLVYQGQGLLYANATCRKCGEQIEIHVNKTIHGKCMTRWCTG